MSVIMFVSIIRLLPCHSLYVNTIVVSNEKGIIADNNNTMIHDHHAKPPIIQAQDDNTG